MNQNLIAAKAAKNDEFYTQLDDINREVNAYLEYDENVFRGKTILLPCDDPEWSNFTKFFVIKFKEYGLKKLISTSYAFGSKPLEGTYAPTEFEIQSPKFDPEKSVTRGKIFVLTDEKIKKGSFELSDVEWDYLEGDGDFRSEEVTALRYEADFIITNPPFSLFREFLAWIVEADKKFLILGSMNAITYKEVFPMIKDNYIWLGVRNGAKTYSTPEGTPKSMGNTVWFTNIEHGKRHTSLRLKTKAKNLRFNKNLSYNTYKKYDNYEAIEVPGVLLIPSDYGGVMGVPISFLDKYCPEQFEILGIDRYIEDNPIPNKRFTIEGNEIYARILIKHKV